MGVARRVWARAEILGSLKWWFAWGAGATGLFILGIAAAFAS